MRIHGLEQQVIHNKRVGMLSSNIHMHYYSVTGEANFSMKSTSLTVGGFNQPTVARFLIELPGNAEKGLSQRFLWYFPKPVYGEFDTLEETDKEFTDKAGIHMYTRHINSPLFTLVNFFFQLKRWLHCGGRLQDRK